MSQSWTGQVVASVNEHLRTLFETKRAQVTDLSPYAAELLEAAADLTMDWSQLWTIQGKFSAHDVWAKKAAGDTTKPYTAKVESHDVLLFRLTPEKK